MLKTSSLLISATVLAFSAASHAAPLPTKSGAHACSVVSLTQGNGEIRDTILAFRNPTQNRTLVVDRIRIFDGDGTLLYNQAGASLPGTFASHISPRAGASARVSAMLGSTQTSGAATAILQWRVVGPDAYATSSPPMVGRRLQRTDGSNNTLSESAGRCRRLTDGWY